MPAAHSILRIKGVNEKQRIECCRTANPATATLSFSFFTVKALPIYLRQGDGENGKPNLLEQTWKSKHAGAGKRR